jgi:predicted dehydrogenase
LINILGPAKRVAGVTTKAFDERIATSEAVKGLRIPVKVTTHLAGTIEFHNGAVVTMIMSFDMWRHSLPCIELYGTEGSMKVPDPNGFGGQVLVSAKGDWTEVPLAFPNNARMIGVIDMVRAIRSGRKHRAYSRPMGQRPCNSSLDCFPLDWNSVQLYCSRLGHLPSGWCSKRKDSGRDIHQK